MVSLPILQYYDVGDRNGKRITDFGLTIMFTVLKVLILRRYTHEIDVVCYLSL